MQLNKQPSIAQISLKNALGLCCSFFLTQNLFLLFFTYAHDYNQSTIKAHISSKKIYILH